MNPIFSIAIPSYNYARYLPHAVDSCLSGDPRVEVVVLNNASTDETAEIEARYRTIPAVRWHANDQVIPQQENFNRCVRLCRGAYIKLLPADDYILPGGVGKMLEWINQRPDVHLHGHLALIVDAAGRPLRMQRPYRGDGNPLFISPENAIPGKLRQVVRFKEPTCNIFSREAFDSVGGYRSELSFAFDIEFNMRVARRYPSMLWSEALVAMRRHGASVGAKLAPSVGISNLKDLVAEWRDAQGKLWTTDDEAAACGFVQFRLIELLAQRFRHQPKACARLLLNEMKLMSRVSGWPWAAGTVYRRLRFHDVQRTLKGEAK